MEGTESELPWAGEASGGDREEWVESEGEGGDAEAVMYVYAYQEATGSRQ